MCVCVCARALVCITVMCMCVREVVGLCLGIDSVVHGIGQYYSNAEL